MKVVQIDYEATHNLGDYENEKIRVEVQLDEGDDPKEAVRRARLFVARAFRSTWRQEIDQEQRRLREQLASQESDDFPGGI